MSENKITPFFSIDKRGWVGGIHTELAENNCKAIKKGEIRTYLYEYCGKDLRNKIAIKEKNFIKRQ